MMPTPIQNHTLPRDISPATVPGRGLTGTHECADGVAGGVRVRVRVPYGRTGTVVEGKARRKATKKA
jgi:hypothetical protein